MFRLVLTVLFFFYVFILCSQTKRLFFLDLLSSPLTLFSPSFFQQNPLTGYKTCSLQTSRVDLPSFPGQLDTLVTQPLLPFKSKPRHQTNHGMEAALTTMLSSMVLLLQREFKQFLETQTAWFWENWSPWLPIMLELRLKILSDGVNGVTFMLLLLKKRVSPMKFLVLYFLLCILDDGKHVKS